MAQESIIAVLSAPSGTGKMALLNALRKTGAEFATTISATTRPPRNGEQEGKDYYFLTKDEFTKKRDTGAFLEWAEVHGNLYGTLLSEMERCLASGKDVLIELDVQGMRNLRKHRNDVVSIFLMPPSLDELERRLRRRGGDSEEAVALRLENAVAEIQARHEFDFVVVNNDLDSAAAAFQRIVHEARARLNNT